MLFSLLILILLILFVGLRLIAQIELYKNLNQSLLCIIKVRASVNKIAETLPSSYIEKLIAGNPQLSKEVDDLDTHLKNSNVFTFNNLNRSKGQKLNDRLLTITAKYKFLEVEILTLEAKYRRLRDWRPLNPPIPSGASKLAWMYGECNWSYFRTCPNLLSEIEYVITQLTKYSQDSNIDKAMSLLYQLDELNQVRSTSIKKTNADRRQVETLSRRYLIKVNYLADLRSQLDNLDLKHLIDTNPNTAGYINELYSLMNIGIHDDWTRDYYQANYVWFDEMVKAEISVDRAITMYKNLERRCKETEEA